MVFQFIPVYIIRVWCIAIIDKMQLLQNCKVAISVNSGVLVTELVYQ